MLRTITLVLALVVVFALPRPSAANPGVPHLRPLDAALKRLVARGVEQSPTLRTLVDRLETTDVVVFLDYDLSLPKDLGGGLRFVTRAGSLRLLRISLSRSLTAFQALQMIGHELQHALEVAGAPQVQDEPSLGAFYRALASRERARERFDTAEAQRAGAEVGHDLRLARGERADAIVAQRRGGDEWWFDDPRDQRTRR